MPSKRQLQSRNLMRPNLSRGAPMRNANGRAVGPSQFHSNILVRHKYRFVSTSGTATQITALSLCGAGGSIGTTVTQVVAFAGTVKVNSVEIWTPVAAQGSSATCSVEWLGLANTSIEVSDTSVSTAVPAHVFTRPPPNSPSSFWMLNNAGNVFNITAPAGSIIDVSLSFIIYDNEANIALPSIVVGTAVVTTVYFLSLDPPATHRFTPVSLTTTF